MPSLPRRPLLAALLAPLLALPLLAITAPSSEAEAQPRQPDQTLSERRYRDRTSVAWIPPGRYTAIVIASNADTRKWIVSLKTNKGNFPVTVSAAETTVIPFTQPWEVLPTDNARLESIDVPFGDIGAEPPLAQANLCLSAWGITANGPVPFTIAGKR